MIPEFTGAAFGVLDITPSALRLVLFLPDAIPLFCETPAAFNKFK